MDGLNIRMEGTEERLSELEDKTTEITWSEQQMKQNGKKRAEWQGLVGL